MTSSDSSFKNFSEKNIFSLVLANPIQKLEKMKKNENKNLAFKNKFDFK